jgi:hypothetical protein
MGWGQLVGAGLGFVVGGPAGAALGASLGGAAEEVSGGGAAGAAQDAANAANASAQADIDLRRRMYEEGVARQQPFLGAGVNALTKMQRGDYAVPEAFKFGAGDYQADPGYAFRLSEGQKALDRSAARRGGLISGGALKAATRFGQDMGSQEYQGAYGRAMDMYNSRVNQANTGYNRLAALAGVGQTTASNIGASGQTYASGAGPQMYQQGVNTGNALIAGQQARESMYGNVGSALGKYLGSSGSGGGYSDSMGNQYLSSGTRVYDY